MKKFVLPLVLCLFHFWLVAQVAVIDPAQTQKITKPGEILVRFDGDIRNLCTGTDRSGCDFRLKETVAAGWHIYLIGFDPAKYTNEQALAHVRSIPGVAAAQLNYRVPDRDITPNDPDWSQQDDMTFIGAPNLWETSTGGVTPNGDTIVVAVLEKGILFTHPDLAANRWYNEDEIPNNDIDDDQNGYIDDYAGWNPRTGADDTGTNGNHGTGVTGIIGAVGNNNVGISGINWNVKVMGICNVEYEDEIIKAYNYVDTMRQIYNATNRQRGAFVVATNASFGLDQEFAADHPLWCAVYDSLGKHGVLSVGATSNQNINVDAQGDMPTSCPSEFLITVNNITKQGVKMPSTGYGATSIDLGAPGHETYTTANVGTNTPGYAKLGGTSAATPHVTGSVALLYSLGCSYFTSDALTDPVSCARRVRDVILLNAEPNATLQGITTTGGHLSLTNALGGVQEICQSMVGTLDLVEVRTRVEGDKLQVFYKTPDFEPYSFRVFNMLGQLMYEETLHPQQFNPNYVEVDVKDLPSGIYVMSISRGKNIASRKFPKF